MNNLVNWLKSRPRNRPATGVVIHATGGSTATGAIQWLRQIGLSYHYVIDKEGAVTKCVPLSRVAFHAGESRGWNGENCNEYTIGIALANRNDGKDPYPKAQMDALSGLVRDLRASLSLTHITSHYAVAPKRKTDPCNLPVGPASTLWGLTTWKPNNLSGWIYKK
jgi:N-acetyl-anhydromuramyl-L-alanine amidase AmpD